MGQPIGNTKRMFLGKGAVVEYQNEMALACPDSPDGMPPASGETPHITRPEYVGVRSVGAQYGRGQLPDTT
jgi:hypothetical protein